MRRKRWAVVPIMLLFLSVLGACSQAGAYERHPAMGSGMMQGMMGPGTTERATGTVPGDSQRLPPVSSLAVAIRDFAFAPAAITVASGATVTWTNEDSVPHTVTSTAGDELDSPLLSKGEGYSHTFSIPGTYTYTCTPHPWMTGIVTVV
jgi:amicyanin